MSNRNRRKLRKKIVRTHDCEHVPHDTNRDSVGLLVQRGEAVVDVHHGEPGVGAEVALVQLGGQGVVEDLHGVVRGPAPRVRVV